jgi:arginyl-tRNA synthetase
MKEALDSVIESLSGFLGGTLPQEQLHASVRATDGRFGDVAVACHMIAKAMSHEGKEADIASWLAENMEYDTEIFSGAETKGAFLNFTLNRYNYVGNMLRRIRSEGEAFGQSAPKEGKVVVDYSAPNIGKPLHIGHIRSTIIGDSLIRIMNKMGYQTHGINYLGDVGLHIGKILWSYERFGDDARLQDRPAEELLRLYVKFGEEHNMHTQGQSAEDGLMASPDAEESEMANSPMMQEARKLQIMLENQDPQLTGVYKKIYDASMQSFDKVYGLLAIDFDEVTGQSRASTRGREVVEEALEQGIASHTEDGAVIVEGLSDHGLPPKIILRSDGGVLYSTQDLGAAHMRFDEHQFDKLIYVVAEEQATYFQQIFKIIEMLGNDWASRCHHLSFGMINMKDEKMSSRQGNIIYLQDVLTRATDYAREIVADRNFTEDEKNAIAHTVGIGAVKYMVLGVDPKRPIEFTWKKALNLDSNSSPSIQYSYARANSLTEGRETETFDADDLLDDTAFGLVRMLGRYPLAIEKAAFQMTPHVIAQYAAGLSRTFNGFYHAQKIIGDAKQDSYLYLTECFKTVTQDALGLLGIGVPEKM